MSMYEHKDQPLLPRAQFIKRAVLHFCFSLSLIILSLGMGVIGYRVFEKYSWLDSLMNAAMILSGMGVVDRPVTDTGKIFASLYALFSGVLFVAGAGIIFAPFVHRILHHLHLQDPDENL